VTMAAYDRVKGFVSAKLLEQLVGVIEEDREDRLITLFETLARVAPARYYRESFMQMARNARENHPFIGVFRRLFSDLHPNCRKKAITNFLVNWVILGRGIRDRKEKELGVHLPNFMVISPTMRCNLHCRGCYASSYDHSRELSFAELDRLLEEAKSLGMYFFTFSGGECFFRKDLLDLWEKHRDCYFHVYTNGTLIDDEIADRLVDMGNVAPMISVEGSREETEARRGPGVYEKVMKAYERLNSKGVLFGFSATCTRNSADYLASDTFIRRMMDTGCKVGWFFQYIPTGEAPDLDYMATPVQRARLHGKIEEWRNRYPVFLGDFWNDGPYVDGCMAAGERYLHINANGDAEPCVFAHFAVDSIREKSLVEIFDSPFFRDIRDRQPYDDDNLLCPCMIIDHPHVLRETVARHGARPTHRQAETILEELAPGLDSYGAGIRRIFESEWETTGRQKYLDSMKKEDKPEALERLYRRLPEGHRIQ